MEVRLDHLAVGMTLLACQPAQVFDQERRHFERVADLERPQADQRRETDRNLP